jgi:nitroimidazol reductase NimA-like FMN-containing flavoprotein (pyridoxamine 5'-phosphate oxidase superfamily)
MLGILTDQQIDHVLNTGFVGRIGCGAKEKIYVVPVTYVYHNGYIYAHSKEGEKIKVMRSNPRVCFEVDSIDNMTNWRCVMLWGTYEELKTEKEQQKGLKIMADRLAPFAISESVRATQLPGMKPESVAKKLKAVAYRIKILERSGRFEKSGL